MNLIAGIIPLKSLYRAVLVAGANKYDSYVLPSDGSEEVMIQKA